MATRFTDSCYVPVARMIRLVRDVKELRLIYKDYLRLKQTNFRLNILGRLQISIENSILPTHTATYGRKCINTYNSTPFQNIATSDYSFDCVVSYCWISRRFSITTLTEFISTICLSSELATTEVDIFFHLSRLYLICCLKNSIERHIAHNMISILHKANYTYFRFNDYSTMRYKYAESSVCNW